MKPWFSFFLVLIPHLVFAEALTVVSDDLNIRSSPTFYGTENIKGLIKSGALVEVLTRTRLRSGANALTVKIISPDDKKYLNGNPPLYVWESGKTLNTAPSKTEAGIVCTGSNCSASTAFASVEVITKKIEEESNTAPATGLSLDQQIQNYSNSDQVQKTIAWAYEKNKDRSSSFLCYRKVKEALATKTRNGTGPGNNLIKSWFPSLSAKNAVNDLATQGFTNLLDVPGYEKLTPQTAPKGAVCVYKTTRHRYGHVEIKLDEGTGSRFAADYVSQGSIMENRWIGNTYTLIGVMIKTDL